MPKGRKSVFARLWCGIKVILGKSITFNFSQHCLKRYAIVAKNFVISNGSPGRLAKILIGVTLFFFHTVRMNKIINLVEVFIFVEKIAT